MARDLSDLSLLTRRTDLAPAAAAVASASVPRPRSRWRTRVLLPAALLLVLAALLAHAGRDIWWPATDVQVVPVVVRTVSDTAGGGGVTVQAPGWVEADPFATSVSALADGVVKDVLVL